MKGSEDGSIVAIDEGGAVSIFGVDSGNLFIIRSLGFFHNDATFLKVSGTQLFVVSSQERRDTVTVLDATTGRRVRSLKVPFRDAFTGTSLWPEALVTNGREIFCGFNIGDASHRSMHTIMVYPRDGDGRDRIAQ